MRLERFFHFFGEDLLAPGVDALATPSKERDATVRLDGGKVARNDPTPPFELLEALGGLHRILVVAERQAARARNHADLAGAWLDLVAVLVQDRDVITHVERGAAFVAVFIGGSAAKVARLAGTKAVDDHHVGDERFKLLLNARRKDGASRSDHAEVRHVVIAGPELFNERNRHGIADEREGRHLLLGNQRQDALRVEARPVLQHQLSASEVANPLSELRRAVYEWGTGKHRDRVPALFGLLDELLRRLNGIAAG